MNLNSISMADPSRRDGARRRDRQARGLLVAAAVLGVGAVISYPVREPAYSTVIDWVAGSDLRTVIGFIAGEGLWSLVLSTGALAGWCFLRARRQFWTLVSAGVGVIAAYTISEGVKVLVARPRPCTGVDIPTVLACPGAGDWSFPSNHSVLAAAFATACVLAVAHSAWFSVPLSLLIAGSRVAAGVHDVHDVLSGLSLGILVVTGLVLALRPVTDRALVARDEHARKRE